jgi:hypothetical protein
MQIQPKTWLEFRDAYIRGEGSLADLSARFGVMERTAERRCAVEGWVRLRKEHAESRLAKLVPSRPTPPQIPPAASVDKITSEWLERHLLAHFVENADLIAKGRKAVAKQMETESLDADQLAKLASTINSLQQAESRLLGLNDKKRKPSFRGGQSFGYSSNSAQPRSLMIEEPPPPGHS